MIRRSATLAALAAALVLVGGCGGTKSNGIQKLPAASAFARVKAALQRVGSVHISGVIHQGNNTIGLDVHLGRLVGEGTLRFGGGTMQMRLVGGEAYLNGDAAVFAAGGANQAEARLAAGHWLKSSATSGPFSDFTTFLILRDMQASLLTPTGPVKAGGTSTYRGKKVLALVDTGSDGGTLYVSETGSPLPVRVAKSGSAGGELTFDGYNETLHVAAPPGAIDISSFAK